MFLCFLHSLLNDEQMDFIQHEIYLYFISISQNKTADIDLWEYYAISAFLI